jgi:hypothetical protein
VKQFYFLESYHSQNQASTDLLDEGKYLFLDNTHSVLHQAITVVMLEMASPQKYSKALMVKLKFKHREIAILALNLH